MPSAPIPVQIRCPACKSRGLALWKGATPHARRRAIDLEDLSAGFLCHDDGRKPAHILCVSCRRPANEDAVGAVAS